MVTLSVGATDAIFTSTGTTRLLSQDTADVASTIDTCVVVNVRSDFNSKLVILYSQKLWRALTFAFLLFFEIHKNKICKNINNTVQNS